MIQQDKKRLQIPAYVFMVLTLISWAVQNQAWILISKETAVTQKIHTYTKPQKSIGDISTAAEYYWLLNFSGVIIQ